jgi:hypothetical protein
MRTKANINLYITSLVHFNKYLLFKEKYKKLAFLILTPEVVFASNPAKVDEVKTSNNKTVVCQNEAILVFGCPANNQ